MCYHMYFKTLLHFMRSAGQDSLLAQRNKHALFLFQRRLLPVTFRFAFPRADLLSSTETQASIFTEASPQDILWFLLRRVKQSLSRSADSKNILILTLSASGCSNESDLPDLPQRRKERRTSINSRVERRCVGYDPPTSL